MFFYVLIFVITLIFTNLIYPWLSKMMRDSGLVKPNYKNELIPAAGGLVFIVVLPIIMGIGLFFSFPGYTITNVTLLLLLTLGTGFMGFLDDQLGNNLNKGFRGHLKAFFQEKTLTTGGFKLFFGALIALFFSLGITKELQLDFWHLFWLIILNFLLVALSTNTINTFDLRPGRAGKFFLLGFVLISIFAHNFSTYFGLLIPLVTILICYLPLDLKAQIMLGDLGSNLLGAALGAMGCWMLDLPGKIVFLTILLGLQFAAEKFSFTSLIEQNKILKSLDDLGRGKK